MYDPATNPQMSSDLSYTKLFDAMQTLIISGIKKLLPPDFDYSPFKVIGERPVTTRIEYGWIVYDLLNHFIRALSENIVTTYDYKLLEAQTQKLESDVRSHIKLEQEIKLYIDSKSRSNEKQKQQLKEVKQYAQYLQNKLKQAEKVIREYQGPLEKNTRSTRSNLNLFKALLVADLENNQTGTKKVQKAGKSLNRYTSEKSSSLQMYVSPRIPENLNLK